MSLGEFFSSQRQEFVPMTDDLLFQLEENLTKFREHPWDKSINLDILKYEIIPAYINTFARDAYLIPVSFIINHLKRMLC